MCCLAFRYFSDQVIKITFDINPEFCTGLILRDGNRSILNVVVCHFKHIRRALPSEISHVHCVAQGLRGFIVNSFV